MPNPIFRERLIARIRNAHGEFKASASLGHRGLRGRVREIAIQELLTPMLPRHLQCVTGALADSEGAQSRQADVVVFDPTLLAPITYEAGFGVIPIEAALVALEVKSELTMTTVRQAVAFARSVRSLAMRSDRVATLFGGLSNYSTRAMLQLSRRAIQILSPAPAAPYGIVPALLAFSTDLGRSGRTEIARYLKVDPDGTTDPAIRMICVLGSGFWRFNQPSPGWHFSPASADHDEAVDFLALIVNSVGAIAASRGRPVVGPYVIKGRPWHPVDGRGNHGPSTIVVNGPVEAQREGKIPAPTQPRSRRGAPMRKPRSVD